MKNTANPYRSEMTREQLHQLKAQNPNRVVLVRERWKNPNVFNVFDIQDVLIMHALGMKAYIQKECLNACINLLTRNGHNVLVADRI